MKRFIITLCACLVVLCACLVVSVADAKAPPCKVEQYDCKLQSLEQGKRGEQVIVCKVRTTCPSEAPAPSQS
jgi:hypothetical protein